MGRTSNKDNKTQYQICRENMGYSREKASEVLGWISADRIERIENGDLCRVRTKCLKCPAGTETRICAIITVRTSVPSGSNMFRR